MPVSPRTAPGTSEPDRLRPYAFHGVSLAPDPNGTHAVGDCPFCGREGKFSVEVCTGLWRCWVCQAGTVNGGGNGLVFARLVHEHAVRDERRRVPFHAAVAQDRRLLRPDTAMAWGLAPAADGTWLVPGYGPDGKLDQLYRRHMVGGKWVNQPTPGIWPEGKGHALHMAAADFDPERPNVIVCEGPWDGMALWEVMQSRESMVNVIAVPGCTTWRDEWTQMLRGKCVTLMFDSDHPREAVPGSGRISRAGYDGMQRVSKRLSGVAASVRYLKWGDGGFDPGKPTGYDVRDFLCGV